MKRLIIISLLTLSAVSAFATAPSPKFLLVGSANSCLGATANVTDFVIDRLSGRYWMMTDAKVCYSDNQGVTWTNFTAGGPYLCFPTTAGVHLKRFQVAPDGTIVMLTGTGSVNCTTALSAWYLDNVADTPTHHGTTYTESATQLRSSSVVPWSTDGTITTDSGIWLLTMTNSNAPSQTMGLWGSTDNGRTYTLFSTRPVAGNNGETFGAFKSPTSNTVYVGFGALSTQCTTWTDFAYTADDGATWTMIPYNSVSNPPCGDTWTPIIIPPGHGAHSGNGLFISGPGIASDNKAWEIAGLDTPTALTFTNITGTMFSGRNGTDHSAMSYGHCITGTDWNSRIVCMNNNWTIAGTTGIAPVWTDSVPTWQQTDNVSGNTLPSFYTVPCTTASPRPNFCLSMATAIDLYPSSPSYGKICIPMRLGALYCTELPQSHLASTFAFTLNSGNSISVNVGADYPDPETIAVSYLDQDTADPTCPAITGIGTLYPSRSAGAWTSSNPAIATVNATTGVVHGVSAGVANPIFTCGGVVSAFGPDINVGGVTLSSVAITPSATQNVAQNATVGFVSVCTYSDATTTDCGFNPPGWTSTNTACVTVAGVSTGHGTATATSTLNQSCTAAIKLTVSSVDSNSVTFNVNSWAPLGLHANVNLLGNLKVLP